MGRIVDDLFTVRLLFLVQLTFSVAFVALRCTLGDRFWTWPGLGSEDVARQVTLLVFVIVIVMGFSVGTPFIPNDLLGLTSRLADNISAHVVGLLLGTCSGTGPTYSRYVFTHPDSQAPTSMRYRQPADTSGGGSGAQP